MNKFVRPPIPFPPKETPDILSPICLNTVPNTVPIPFNKDAKPSNKGLIPPSFDLIFSKPPRISSKTLFIMSPNEDIEPAALLKPSTNPVIPDPTKLRLDFKNSKGFLIISAKPVNTLLKRFVFLTTTSTMVIKLPSFAAISSKKPPSEEMPLPAGDIALTKALIACKPISSNAKKPLAALRILAIVPSVGFKVAENL